MEIETKTTRIETGAALGIAEKPAAPAVTLWRNAQKIQTRSTEFLRANWVSVVFFALAAGMVCKATIGVLNAPPSSRIVDAEVNVGWGYVIALIFYMVAACHLENTKARRVTRTLPFGVGLLGCAGYVVWLIFLAKNPEYGMIIPVAVWSAVLVGFIQISWSGFDLSFLDGLSRAPKPSNTIAAHTKPATARDLRRYGIISDDETED